MAPGVTPALAIEPVFATEGPEVNADAFVSVPTKPDTEYTSDAGGGDTPMKVVTSFAVRDNAALAMVPVALTDVGNE